MLKAVFFDLDGTLLPLNEEDFTKGYFGLLCNYLSPYGYEKDKLIETVWKGTKAMYKNDGTKTNEEAFWKVFVDTYGSDKLKDKEIFDKFYDTDFTKTKIFCSPNPIARQIINHLKENNIKIILATNPIFPRNAINTRLNFVGLNENDFDYITTYDICNYTKSNYMYYVEILKHLNLKPNEVIMFGNNEVEDGERAKEAQITTFMVGDYIIPATPNAHIYEQHKLNDIISIIDQNLE